MLIDKLNKIGTSVERFFNYAGTIPVINLVSAPTRAGLGVIQTTAAIGTTILGASAHEICHIVHASEKTTRDWKLIKVAGEEHMVHGVLNVGRGISEIFLGFAYVVIMCELSRPLGDVSYYELKSMEDDEEFMEGSLLNPIKTMFKYGTWTNRVRAAEAA